MADFKRTATRKATANDELSMASDSRLRPSAECKGLATAIATLPRLLDQQLTNNVTASSNLQCSSASKFSFALRLCQQQFCFRIFISSTSAFILNKYLPTILQEIP
jgi:hypothetical protein